MNLIVLFFKGIGFIITTALSIIKGALIAAFGIVIVVMLFFALTIFGIIHAFAARLP